MNKKWFVALLAAALLTLGNAGIGMAQAQYTGASAAKDIPTLHPAGFAAGGIKGKYLTGDFHNHTPFSDGTASVPLLVGHAMQNLDWFAQSGHGGAYSRDGRYSDPENDGSATGEGKFLDETVGAANFMGIYAGTQYGHQKMWRWQSVQQFLYPETYKNAMALQKPVMASLEWNVPGHEHCSSGVIDGQFPASGQMGNANAMAQFEYLFDASDKDTSEGGGQGWTGKIFPSPATGSGSGIAGHAKAVAAATWLEQYHKYGSYLVFAHIERAGGFNPDSPSGGYNVESFRDFNNAAPDVCFGFEGQPGHQAESGRGGFGSGAVGGGTFGGTGYYSATIGGLWDALLGEGRNWWLFASSDYHSRSVTEEPAYNSATNPAGDPNQPTPDNPIQNPDTLKSNWRGVTASKADFWPGEYQKDYVFVKSTGKATPQDVINGMRSGNSFIVEGDLIRGLQFTAKGTGPSATMGERLTVGPNKPVTVTIKVYAPDVNNQCPYAIPNPSLAPVGINQSLNRPVLHHVDVIGGEVYGKRTPGSAEYTNATNPTTEIKRTVLVSDMTDEGEGWKSFTYTFTPAKSCYLRLRGTNMPPNTLNETDAQGNPLLDVTPNTDVAAWADLWFYSNPIFIKVGTPSLAFNNDW